LQARLRPLIRKSQPYAKKIAHPRRMGRAGASGRYRVPREVAEGKVRHPLFKGLGRTCDATRTSDGSDIRPFLPKKDEAATTWVRPSLVAEVKFAEWTSKGELRQPVYLGLRSDKHAKDVVRERERSRK
jgi:hypothetical protein